MRTFKVTLTEEELKAVIRHNASHFISGFGAKIDSNVYTTEQSSRIHELTKKLNKSVEVEDKTEQQPEIKEEHAKGNTSAISGWS